MQTQLRVLVDTGRHGLLNVLRPNSLNRHTCIYGRVSPEQRASLIHTKGRGEVDTETQ